jgi:hypothetical protein
MITPFSAFASNTMLPEYPRAAIPCSTMIKHLGCSSKRGSAMLCEPATFRKPTHLRIHVADDECWQDRKSSFHFCKLESLCHTYGLCNGSPELITNLIIGLHVGVDESESVAAAAIVELDAQPALRN